MDNKKEKKSQIPIAIVGLGALFAESPDVAAFWNNIVEGKDLITDVPPTHWLIQDFYDPDRSKTGKVYVRRGSFIPPTEFDPLEFGIPPNTIGPTDPSQLLSLIVAKKLLEETRSFQEKKVSAEKTSIIIGAAGPTSLQSLETGLLAWPHWQKALRDQGLPEDQVNEIKEKIFKLFPVWNEDTFPGLLGNVIAGRIANRLDLKGTNCIVDAACAGSLAALKMSIMELETGEADLVISGGVDALNDIMMYSCFSKTGALSPSEDCRPFSSAADGTMLGEGISLFALRRLEDAERDGDTIFAVIKGIGSSSDGKGMSVYAPQAKGQALAVERAYENAGCSPEEVGLVEAHGTATAVGDVAEFHGLTAIFGKKADFKRQRCALGSIKSQIGHCKGAAGAAGLFKAIMALHQKVLPPVIKVDAPNPKLKLEESPFYLNTQTRPWIHPGKTSRKAAVSSFGFGGTNFHVVLEEYRNKKSAPLYHSKANLFLFSSEDMPGLEKRSQEVIEGFRTRGFSVLAKDTQKTFDPFSKQRLAIIASSEQEYQERLKKAFEHIRKANTPTLTMPCEYHYSSTLGEPKIAFIFPGQGSQYCGMGGALAMTFPASRQVWDAAAEIQFDPLLSLQDVVFPIPVYSDKERLQQEARLKETAWAQLSIGTVALSQLALLNKIHLMPDFVAGHSSGEVTALFAGGSIPTEKELLQILRKRGELMAENRSPGAMTAVMATADIVQKILKDLGSDVIIANFNSPKQQVLSGSLTGIEAVEQRLLKEGLKFQRLPVSTGFHSGIVKASSEPFLKYLEGISFEKSRIPVYANMTATAYPSQENLIRTMLADQLAQPVKFQQEIEALYDQGVRVFLEIGPKTVLSGLVRTCLEGKEYTAVSLDNREKQGLIPFWNALGAIAVAGVPMQLGHLWDDLVIPEIKNTKPKSLATVKITGAVYGKPYPLKNAMTEQAASKNPPKKQNDAPLQNQERSTGMNEEKPKQIPPPKENEISAQSPSEKQTQQAKNTPPKMVEEQVVPSQINTGEEWLKALHELQTNALEAQKQFQEVLTQNHQAYLKLVETALHEMGQLGGHPISETQIKIEKFPSPLSAEATAKKIAPEKEKQQRTEIVTSASKPATIQVPPTKKMLSPPIDINSSQPDQIPIPTPIPAQKAATPQPQPAMPKAAQASAQKPTTASNAHYNNLLLDIVAENTGYPKEMLDLDMELEAGLGIDSIKRVEILSGLQEKVPELANQDTSKMTQLRTLRAILDFLQGIDGSLATTTNTSIETSQPGSASSTTEHELAPQAWMVKDKLIDHPESLIEQAPQPSSPPVVNGFDFTSLLLDIIAENTGYPKEMLDLDMELEAGLGIDSIKRVEILSALQEKVPQLAEQDTSKMTQLRTIRAILDFIEGSTIDKGSLKEKKKPVT